MDNTLPKVRFAIQEPDEPRRSEKRHTKPSILRTKLRKVDAIMTSVTANSKADHRSTRDGLDFRCQGVICDTPAYLLRRVQKKPLPLPKVLVRKGFRRFMSSPLIPSPLRVGKTRGMFTSPSYISSPLNPRRLHSSGSGARCVRPDSNAVKQEKDEVRRRDGGSMKELFTDNPRAFARFRGESYDSQKYIDLAKAKELGCLEKLTTSTSNDETYDDGASSVNQASIDDKHSPTLRKKFSRSSIKDVFKSKNSSTHNLKPTSSLINLLPRFVRSSSNLTKSPVMTATPNGSDIPDLPDMPDLENLPSKVKRSFTDMPNEPKDPRKFIPSTSSASRSAASSAELHSRISENAHRMVSGGSSKYGKRLLKDMSKDLGLPAEGTPTPDGLGISAAPGSRPDVGTVNAQGKLEFFDCKRNSIEAHLSSPRESVYSSAEEDAVAPVTQMPQNNGSMRIVNGKPDESQYRRLCIRDLELKICVTKENICRVLGPVPRDPATQHQVSQEHVHALRVNAFHSGFSAPDPDHATVEELRMRNTELDQEYAMLKQIQDMVTQRYHPFHRLARGPADGRPGADGRPF
ncbi:hypothetical protein EJ08DRAFT_682431 [Tothia fuscella]|uniref:Uncharacterized protein n=1 Tax=Tothia fuscella TaxID=1048955 RepID=A0A9P4TUX3_9PEZI|nr:hypothetical protein EJ08DRAFT_682431 [Tothia fuscella]